MSTVDQTALFLDDVDHTALFYWLTSTTALFYWSTWTDKSAAVDIDDNINLNLSVFSSLS